MACIDLIDEEALLVVEVVNSRAKTGDFAHQFRVFIISLDEKEDEQEGRINYNNQRIMEKLAFIDSLFKPRQQKGGNY